MTDIEPLSLAMKHTEEEVDRGLLAYAEAGSAEKASKDLEAIGKPISKGTLVDWRKRFPQRYASIVASRRPQLDKILAADFRDLARLKMAAQQDAIRIVHDRLLNGESRDPSQDLQRLSVATGIDVDKLGLLEGRPQVHEVHHVDLNELLADINSRAPGLIIESTAVEE